MKRLKSDVSELRIANTVKEKDLLAANDTIKKREERIKELESVEKELRETKLVVEELQRELADATERLEKRAENMLDKNEQV